MLIHFSTEYVATFRQLLFHLIEKIFITAMMRYILLFSSASMTFTVILSSCLLDDPGEALYLTKYIESGDIESVNLLRYHFLFNCDQFPIDYRLLVYDFFFCILGSKSVIGFTERNSNQKLCRLFYSEQTTQFEFVLLVFLGCDQSRQCSGIGVVAR